MTDGDELEIFAFAVGAEDSDSNVESFVFSAATKGGALTLIDGTELETFAFAVGAEDSESDVVVGAVLYSPDLKNKWKSQ